jgi:hypothetical protein
MNRAHVYTAALLVLGFSAYEASALPIPFFDDFSSITVSALNAPPTGWNTVVGTVDSVKNGDYGLRCFEPSGGCVDTGGTSALAGYLITSPGTFNLAAGQTYQLSAQISGNQRGAVASNLTFGFSLSSSPLVALMSQTIVGIASDSPYTLYSVLFTPATAMSAVVFFNDTLGDPQRGPMLDDVRVTAVPLPAAAWLMLSGLAALGAVARRRISAATRASNLQETV